MDLKITGAKLSGDVEKDVKILANHVFQLEEQLRYQLRNLDATNFNDLGLARYENGRLQVYAKEVSLQTDKLRVEFGKETDEIYALISATAEELEAKIEANGDYTSLKATVDGIQTTVSGHTKTINSHTSSINSHTSSINSHATSISSLQSQITQTSDKISAVVSAVDDSSGNVTAASIVAAINATSGSSMVKIEADHIKMTGTTTFVSASDLSTAGRTVIDAGNISTGSISANRISGGTLSGVRVESVGEVASWDDPLSGVYQEISMENGLFNINNTKFYDSGPWSGFTVETNRAVLRIVLYGGTYYEFATNGIYKNGSYVAG